MHVFGATTLCAVGCLLVSCSRPKPAKNTNVPGPPASFRDIAAEAGINFRHFNGATGDFYFPEIVGSGVALLDYDGDGDLDVYLLQGNFLDPTKSLKQALHPPPPAWKAGNRLFRNELIPTGKLQFTDVTERAGVGVAAVGMGVAVGDYNNDGRPDLYVTTFGRNILYRNNGDGTFTDVTLQAGVDDKNWSTSAAFCDYDGDGYVDLVVAHYVDFPVNINPRCQNPAGERDYCGPKVFKATSSRLFHNLRNGRFADVTGKAGFTAAVGAGLGVACADFDRDGNLDIYVANDQHPNNLWLNLGGGRFEDAALTSGAAYGMDAKAMSGMGVTAGDFDNDGWDDIFVTNLTGETNSLFHNTGRGLFEESALRFGLALPSLPYTGFGTGWFDFDNDGLLDLFVANGAVETMRSPADKRHPYAQKNRLYHNVDGRRFADISEASGPALQLLGIGRAAAFGDINNDGAIDVVVSNNNGPARLILNETASRGNYLTVELEGVTTNRMGLGAEVFLHRSGRKPLFRRAHTDGSYLAAGDPRVHFGLGDDPRIDNIVVKWRGGGTEFWSGITANRLIHLRENTGRPWHGAF